MNSICDLTRTSSSQHSNDLGDEGLYYFNARWYDPQLGRFTTEDPIRDGANWFAYVSNNPMMFVDPTGLLKVHRKGVSPMISTVKILSVSIDKDSNTTSTLDV